MPILKMTDVDLHAKRILIREDFNVPLQNGQISSDARIRAALPTIALAQRAGAKIILMSHLGRPTPQTTAPEFSLAPVAARLTQLLQQPVRLVTNWLDGFEQAADEIVLCENVRLQSGELENDTHLAQKMAALCDVFVMDAFATAHRVEASTVGVAQFAPVACAGLLLNAELDALTHAFEHPARPLIAIIGGAKVSTKLTVLTNLISKVDKIIVGGGIANTFLAAQGLSIGSSLYEPNLLDTARELMAAMAKQQVELLVPSDVQVAPTFSATAPATLKTMKTVAANEMILDIGPSTAQRYTQALAAAGTIIWNGPVGVFEFPAFAHGTQHLAQAIATSSAFSIAGGGDTLAAIEQFHITEQISYISTGGGAFLEFMEGKDLPAIKVLRARHSK